MPPVRVLVTGASGFIGTVVCRRLREAGADVCAAMRDRSGDHRADIGADVECIRVGNIDGNTDWRAALRRVAVVVHLAARTHAPLSRRGHEGGKYRAVNVDGTRALAEQAMRSGVERFVYMSSIKVNGEESPLGEAGQPRRFSGIDPPRPVDDYGKTKRDAEIALKETLAPTGATLVILRPPLVYGPGQKGNLLRLMRWVAGGIPLPFATVSNVRSLVYVENLAQAVVDGVLKPSNGGGIFTLADVDISTPALIEAIAGSLGKPARLFPFPVAMLRAAASVVGVRPAIERLTGNLLVDSSEIRSRLGWEPSIPFPDAMAATAAWFRTVQP